MIRDLFVFNAAVKLRSLKAFKNIGFRLRDINKALGLVRGQRSKVTVVKGAEHFSLEEDKKWNNLTFSYNKNLTV